MHDPRPSAPDFPVDLGPALRALPLLAPPVSALPGLLAELAARRRRRALLLLVPLAAAALLVLALLPRNTPQPQVQAVTAAVSAPAAGVDPELGRLMRANAALEQRLARTRSAHVTQDGDAAQASAQMEDMIGLVDATLGSDPAPAQRLLLWQRRLELLEALNQVQRRGSLAPAEAENGQVYLASF